VIPEREVTAVLLVTLPPAPEKRRESPLVIDVLELRFPDPEFHSPAPPATKDVV
jgi:hypothetical protein